MSPSQLENPPEIDELRCQLEQSESVQLELDRRIFNLKTLYDVSKDIFSSVDSEVILRNFLLMVMGNFGVAEGVVMLFDGQRRETEHFTAVGLQQDDIPTLQQRFATNPFEDSGRQPQDRLHRTAPFSSPIAIPSTLSSRLKSIATLPARWGLAPN